MLKGRRKEQGLEVTPVIGLVKEKTIQKVVVVHLLHQSWGRLAGWERVRLGAEAPDELKTR